MHYNLATTILGSHHNFKIAVAKNAPQIALVKNEPQLWEISRRDHAATLNRGSQKRAMNHAPIAVISRRDIKIAVPKTAPHC